MLRRESTSQRRHIDDHLRHLVVPMQTKGSTNRTRRGMFAVAEALPRRLLAFMEVIVNRLTQGDTDAWQPRNLCRTGLF